jgi:hypothetical protein
MSEQRTKSVGEIMLENVRIAFPVLWKPERVNDQGEPRYSACLLLERDHPAINGLKAVLRKVAQGKWKDKAGDVLKQLVAQDRVCLHDGDTKANYEGFPGNLYVSASSKIRPLALARDKTPLSEGDGVIYSGCRVNAKLDIWAQDNKFGKRLNAQLQGVQFCVDDEAFTGGGRPADVSEFAQLESVDEAGEFGDLLAGEGQAHDDDMPY